MTFEEIEEKYIVIEAESIRYDINGLHHTGYDAVDPEDGTLWGVFENAGGECYLMR